MDDITDKDISNLWWTAYNNNDTRTARLCTDALGNQAGGGERDPDPAARLKVERIICGVREAQKEAARHSEAQAGDAPLKLVMLECKGGHACTRTVVEVSPPAAEREAEL